MNFPDYYAAQKVGDLYAPDAARAVAAGRAAGLSQADADGERIMLLLVDAQVDFIHPTGALHVPGAVEDTCRIIEWLYNHVERVTTIAASLDSHLPNQIFFPTWWQDAAGKHPEPFTVITSADVSARKWQPIFERKWSREYVKRLEQHAKKQLMIWPFHTLIGTQGHNLMPALYEAAAYHSAARQSQPIFLSKGSIAKTEHYSIFEPEVKVPGEAFGKLNTTFLKTIAGYDRVYVAGQAKSHCVLETVTSIMRHFAGENDIIEKFHVLMDCMSSVAHPDIDFDRMADEVFARFEAEGVRLVQSSDTVN